MYIYACIKDYVSKKYDIDDMIKKGVSRLTDSERPAELDPAKLNDLVLVCGSGGGGCMFFVCTLVWVLPTVYYAEYRSTFAGITNILCINTHQNVYNIVVLYSLKKDGPITIAHNIILFHFDRSRQASPSTSTK